VKAFSTKYGHFSEDGKEYVITSPRTPRPWINVISNGDYGITVSQAGSGYSWRTHAQLNRVTRWEQDLIKDEWGKYLYLTDNEGHLWSAGWKPVCAEPRAYRCRHGIGYSVIESLNHGIASELLVFVPNEEPMEIWKLILTNRSSRSRRLKVFSYLEWCLGQAPDWHREFHRSFIETRFEPRSHTILATKRLWEVPTERGHWNTEWPYVGFHSISLRPFMHEGDKESFLGMYESHRAPASIVRGRSAQRTGNWLDPIASLGSRLALKPGQTATLCFTLGAADSREQAAALAKKYHSVSEVDRALASVHKRWEGLLRTVEVSTPDDAMNLMENVWLKYQAISGRIWGRTAYYQTGGAFGFRDQLQDSQVFLPIDPERTKQQILLHARHQFKDGSVYHWWHPITEIGLHNNMSDNLLWLPFVVNNYLQETADLELLQAHEPFVDDPGGGTVFEHCARAIDRVWGRRSPRGIPLIGAGDWNDGLSAVGLDMKGESVWLGFFLHRILLDFADIAQRIGDKNKSVEYRGRAQVLRDILNAEAWDGGWYWRATKDSGEKLGSAENREGRIYLNAQTWAILADVADPARGYQVMDAVKKHLDRKAGPLLLSPGYTIPDKFIGYLTRYSAGMRENGGVYTHAATWAVAAAAKLGRAEDAYSMYSKITPINRGMKPEEYMAEPYVTSGNIEGPQSAFFGRGGWSWYSGSAAWLFRVGLEWILGIRPTVDGLLIDPCIPIGWKGFSVRRTFRGAIYHIRVKNPDRVSSGVVSLTVDGVPYSPVAEGKPNPLPAFPAGTQHEVEVRLGKRN
jgi:cellobiose phosphorylase